MATTAMMRAEQQGSSSKTMETGCSKVGELKLIDIGSNLTDPMYQGIYNSSSSKHAPDLDKVISRAWAAGLTKIIVTAGSLAEAEEAVKICDGEKLFSTVGVHPTRTSTEFFEQPKNDNNNPPSPTTTTTTTTTTNYINSLKSLIISNKSKIVAIGEFGLDYDRTNFSPIETQKKYFTLQLQQLAKPFVHIPLFLHCRGDGAAKDLLEILQSNRDCWGSGVVHSFDGSVEDAELFVGNGLMIGVNGCSLKTEANCEVVKSIPMKSLLLETDSPWCGIRPSHASNKYVKTKFEVAKKNWKEDCMFKSRNEPQTLRNVLEVVAGLKQMDEKELADVVYRNTIKLFFNKDKINE